MVTIITLTDCLMFNMTEFTQEKRLVDCILHHKKNKTGKFIKITTGGREYTVYSGDVVDCCHESRVVSKKILSQIDYLTKDKL